MAKKSKTETAIDKRVADAYRASCDRVVINIMDIGKVMAVGRKAVVEGADETTLRTAIRAFVDTIRVIPA